MIRWAVDGLLDYVKAHDGKLHLPLDFTTAWTQLRALVEADEALPRGGSPVPLQSRLNEEPVKYPAARTGTK